MYIQFVSTDVFILLEESEASSLTVTVKQKSKSVNMLTSRCKKGLGFIQKVYFNPSDLYPQAALVSMYAVNEVGRSI